MGALDFRLSGLAGMMVAGVAEIFPPGGARTLFLIWLSEAIFSDSEFLGETGALASDPATDSFSTLDTDLD